ncbi:MAG: glycosyltransferase [Minisyncoccia bacterium]
MIKKRKLNIAIICDPIGDYKAGVIVSTMRFSKLLTDRGHHLIFIGAKSKEYKIHSHHIGIKAYRFRSLPIPKSGGWNTAFPSVKELKDIFTKEKIDVVHIILPMSAAIVAIRAARSLRIKIVAHSHSQPENLFMDSPWFIRPMLNKLWNNYLTWVYSKTEHIIYPSEMARRLLDKLTRIDQPSTVISNGIHTGEFKPLPIGDFLERFSLPSESTKLLFVGRLFPEKSIDTLIEAMPHIIKVNPKVHLMIVGGGHLKGKLQKLVVDKELHNHVTFLGLVSDEDRVFAYNASDIFILPSLAELEGMVVLEAMACGKPIVISDAEMSASRYFVDGNGFLFQAQNPEHLAEQVLKLVLDKELRLSMGVVSLQKSKDYDIERSTDKLEEVYYSALEQN